VKRALATLLLLLASCVTPGPHEARAPGEDFVRVDGAWLRVLDTGPQDDARAPVVLVHGYGSRLETWREVQAALDDDRRVISFDMRGFGESERPTGAYGPERHARDLWAVLDQLGVDSAVLAGHSYGGGVVLRAAVESPERALGVGLVSSFALEDQIPTSFRWAQVPGVGELLFGAFYQEVPGEKYLLAFHDRERFVTLEALDEMKRIMAEPGSVYAAMQTVRGMKYDDVQARYGDLEVPVHIVWGRDDRVLPLSQGERLASVLDAPMTVLDDCGHVPAWERPKGVVRAMSALLDEVDR
jgi:pimeloyl-ACP methyl ester carboxylesterase